MISRGILGAVLRLVLVIAFVLAAIQLGEWVKATLDLQILPASEARAFRFMILALLIYSLLLAVPFVPGAEIGISLMAIFGASAAPLVYGATILGLTLAFLVGALVPPEATCRFLNRLGLRRIAELVASAHAARRNGEPATLLRDIRHPWLLRLARHRYLTFAILINLPGNTLIGGGGGMALLAGLSGTFGTGAFLLTVAVAVLPVPFAVYVLGYPV